MKTMLTFVFAIFATLFSLDSSASTIKTKWKINNFSQYNYLTGQYEIPSVPDGFELEVSFPNVVESSTDYGTTSITYLGNFGETKFSSALTQFVGTDPFGNGIEDRGYAFPNVSDYPSTFFEGLAFQSNTYNPLGSRWWSYHIELRVSKYTDSRGGTGNEDYFFTPSKVNEFLEDILAKPEDFRFIFNESWGIYDRDIGEYIDGFSWSSYNEDVTLLEVSHKSINVTEPANFSLLFMTTFIVFSLRYSKNHPKRANRK